jgi:hypothetical protein
VESIMPRTSRAPAAMDGSSFRRCAALRAARRDPRKEIHGHLPLSAPGAVGEE